MHTCFPFLPLAVWNLHQYKQYVRQCQCLILRVIRVVCRMLGFRHGYVMSSNVPGNGTIWLDDVSCTGFEEHLSDCSHSSWGSHNCDHRQDVGIVCDIEELGNSMRIYATSLLITSYKNDTNNFETYLIIYISFYSYTTYIIGKIQNTGKVYRNQDSVKI